MKKSGDSLERNIEKAKENSEQEAAGTRVYSTKRKKDVERKGFRMRQQQTGEYTTDDEGFKIHSFENDENPLQRIGMMVCGFLLAGMLLFILSGYERISRAYADVNALNEEIELANLRIIGLDVEIECAVTIQDARQAAENAGMQYPDPEQLVKLRPVNGNKYTFTMPVLDTGSGGAGINSGSIGSQVPDRVTDSAEG